MLAQSNVVGFTVFLFLFTSTFNVGRSMFDVRYLLFPAMSDSIDNLYQDHILDHYKHPRHTCELADGEEDAERLNPTCGDRVRLRVKVEQGSLVELSHDTRGCAVSIASASMMTEALQARSVEAAQGVLQGMLDLLDGKDPDVDVGDLKALSEVRAFPLRIRCAALPWLALQDALAPK